MYLERLEKHKRGEDIISKLPDDILSRILSHLSAKDAVKTCILSSRWKNLWTLIYNLHFEYSGGENYKRYSFMNFVDRVLSLNQSKNMKEFHLNFQYLESDDLSRVIAWISFAINRRVRCLKVGLHIEESWREWYVKLPQSILTCTTLVKLSLFNDFAFDIPDSMLCFPSLKILDISIAYPDSALMKKLFRSCPVLEDLSIYGSDLDVNDYLLTFDICVPTLKKLRIWHIVDYYDFEGVSKHNFVITAVNLEYLHIQDGSLASIMVNESSSLNEVSLDVGVDRILLDTVSELDDYEVSKDEANRAMELLKGISSTEILSLTFRTMETLSLAFNDNMPTFPNLIHLELGIEACFGWKLLLHFLNNSPKLEELVLVKDQRTEIISENFVLFETKSAPSCLRLHVKMIQIGKIRGEDDELEVISYMLRNSEVLEEFYVDIVDNESKADLQRQILMYPRCSAACEIEFL